MAKGREQASPREQTAEPSPRRLIIRFSALFLFLILCFSTLFSTGPAQQQIHEPLARFIARIVGTLLSPLGQTSIQGNYLGFKGFQVTIVEACNGILPTYIYLSAVLAFPSDWRAKGWGMLIGIPAIFVINLVRVASLMLLGAYRPEIFERVHIYVWQALVIALTVAVWIIWAEKFVRKRGLAGG